MKLFDVYPLFDINIVKGEGTKVWDEKGQEYLDLYGGHAVISIGHCHPHYTAAITKQLDALGFYSNSVINKLEVTLAERLGKISGYDDYQFFLINSGAEANENALKLASFTNGRKRVLALEKSFHGRTSLAVEVTNNPKIVAPINDNGHVTFLPINNLGNVSRVLADAIWLLRSLLRDWQKPARSMEPFLYATRYNAAMDVPVSFLRINGSTSVPTLSQ